MDLDALRSFTTLAKLCNLSRTAEALHLSPAAIHKQLKNLEQTFRTRLYEKIGRRLQLTAAGQMLLPYATDLLKRYEDMLSMVELEAGRKRGTVRLGTGPGLAVAILPDLLTKFRRANPGVEVVVETGSTAFLIGELTEATLDVAIMVSHDPPEQKAVRVAASWVFPIVLVTGAAEVPRRCSLRDLADIPFTLFREGSQVQRAIDNYFAEMNFRPRVTMRFDNAEAIKVILKVSPSISMLPRWAVEKEIRNGSLRMVQQKERTLQSRIIIVVRRAGYLPPAAATLVALARQSRFPWLAPQSRL